MKFQVGDKAKDPVTGIEGTITERSEYLGGSPRCFIERTIGPNGEFYDGKWFEEGRLEAGDGLGPGESPLKITGFHHPFDEEESPRE